MTSAKSASITDCRYVQELTCRISLTLDAWTSPNSPDFLAVTGHCIDESWVLRCVLLELIHINDAHTGENMAKAVMSSLAELNITKKVILLVSKNKIALYIDAFFRSLRLLPTMRRTTRRLCTIWSPPGVGRVSTLISRNSTCVASRTFEI